MPTPAYAREHAEISRLLEHVARSHGAPPLPAGDRRYEVDALELVAALERAEEHVQDPAVVDDAVTAFIDIITARAPLRPVLFDQAQTHIAWIYQQMDTYTGTRSAA